MFLLKLLKNSLIVGAYVQEDMSYPHYKLYF
jgi:hypothetical protein